MVMNRPVSARVKTVKASLLTQFTLCETLQRYPPSCFVPLPQRSRPGLGWVGLQAISVVYNSTWYDQLHTGTTMFDRNAGYFCVRSFNSSLEAEGTN